jgi:YaiO family outer membrane protein
MNEKNMKKLLLLILILISSIKSYGQLNTDSLFNKAVEFARLKKYDSSIVLSKRILETKENRVDVLTFLASVYAWSNNYSEAKNYIEKAMEADGRDLQIFPVWLNILQWNKEYQKLLTACDYAETRGYPDKFNLINKRISAYKGLNRYKDAYLFLDDSLKRYYPSFSDFYDLKQDLYLSTKRNGFTFNYSLNAFDSIAPQHLYYFEYSRKFKGFSATARINYADRFGKTGAQAEIDMYTKLGSRWYLYLNYGYGFEKSLFPEHRAGAEVYFPLFRVLDASIGGRFLKFENSQLFIATASLSRYTKRSWYGLRSFISFKESGTSVSLIGSYRLYSQNRFNYWGVELSYGTSPDDRVEFLPNLENRMISYKIKTDAEFLITKSTFLNLAFGYNYEEYFTEKFRNRYIFEISYKIRF